MIDAHSKWIEAVNTTSISSQFVIQKLKVVFENFGLPETIVTDNGFGFTSGHFLIAMVFAILLQHLTTHPASNGMAERALQIVKKGLKKVNDGSIKERLARILFAYLTTPQSTTGLTPAEMLLRCKPRTHLNLIKPNTAERVEQKQKKQKEGHDSKAKAHMFRVGDSVFVKNNGTGKNKL